MPLGSLFHLFRVRLRPRLVQEMLALLGIAVGVALVFAALVANTSLSGSVRQLTSGIVGDTRFQLAARGPDGFDARVLQEVQRLPGVRAAAPILEAPANVIGPNGRRSVTLVGGDPRFAQIGGTLLRSFTADELARQRAVALPTPMADALGVRLYARVTIETGAMTASLPVGADLGSREIGPLVHSPVAITPIAYAQELTGQPGRVSRIFVEPEPGRDHEVEVGLRRLAGDRLNVLPAQNDVTLFDVAAYPTSQSTAIFSVFSALVGFLFAFTAVLLTVPQRRKLVADMRLSGYESWVQVEVLLFDALVLGVVGSALGIALGDQLSRHVFDAAPGYLAHAFAVGSQRIVTAQSVALAVGAGIVAACVAVLTPLRDILTARAAPEPGAHRQDLRKLAIGGGLACLAATTAVIVLLPEAALAGLILLTLALLLLLPSLIRGAAAAFGYLTRATKSPVPTLAVIEVRSGAARMRTIALAATGAIAVFATVSIGGANADLERGLNAAASEVDANGDVWVTMRGDSNLFAVSPFLLGGDVRRTIEAVEGVRSVGVYRGSFLDVGEYRAWVQAPPRSASDLVPPTQLREGDAELATRRLRSGGWVVLSRTIADRLDAHLGDIVRLPTPSPITVRVAGVSNNIGWPSGSILLNADDYAQAWDTTAASALHVRLEPDAVPERVVQEIRDALAPFLPAYVETSAERQDRHRESTRDGLARLSQITVLVLLSAMLAMAAAMAGMIWQRRPAFAGLKVHGYAEPELWRALLVEAGLLLGAGCLAGAVFGLCGQLLLTRALETITGFPVIYSTAGLVAAGILALVTTVAVAMLAIPGWLAVRVRPMPGGAT